MLKIKTTNRYVISTPTETLNGKFFIAFKKKKLLTIK
jgi:hypothetical protein